MLRRSVQRNFFHNGNQSVTLHANLVTKPFPFRNHTEIAPKQTSGMSRSEGGATLVDPPSHVQLKFYYRDSETLQDLLLFADIVRS